MKILYYCQTGAHTSMVAAAIHLGLLPLDQVADSRQLLGLPHYNKIRTNQIGSHFYLGRDRQGNMIYSLGVGYDSIVIEKAMNSFMEKMHIPQNYKLISTLPAVNKYTSTGSLISVSGWQRLAQPLVTYGIRKNYEKIVSIVSKTLDELAKFEDYHLSKVIPFPIERVKE